MNRSDRAYQGIVEILALLDEQERAEVLERLFENYGRFPKGGRLYGSNGSGEISLTPTCVVRLTLSYITRRNPVPVDELLSFFIEHRFSQDEVLDAIELLRKGGLVELSQNLLFVRALF